MSLKHNILTPNTIYCEQSFVNHTHQKENLIVGIINKRTKRNEMPH